MNISYNVSQHPDHFMLKNGINWESNAVHKFPRVTLVLDDKTMALTDQCKADLVKITDQTTLNAFLEDYGKHLKISRIQSVNFRFLYLTSHRPILLYPGSTGRTSIRL